MAIDDIDNLKPGDPQDWGPVCPECAQGKHQNCVEVALDEKSDTFTTCACLEHGHAERA